VIQVQAIDDHEAEPYREGFQILPVNPAAGYGAVAGDDKYYPYQPDGQSAAYGFIQDNDYDLSLSVNDSAIEGQDGVAGFDIYRYGDLRQPVTVSFDVGGSATLGEDYDSSPFDAGQVTFAAGESDAWLALTPTDDETAEWTEDVVLTIHPSDTTDINGDAFATAQIVDDDPVDVIIQGLPEETEASPNEMDPGAFFGVNDDDDNDNGTADNKEMLVDLGDDDLEPVQLKWPQEAKAGSTITLSLTGDGNSFRVWKDDGTQLLGVFGGAGDPVTSVVLDPTDGPNMTVYLEALAAGPTGLVLQATDAPATTRPSNSPDMITGYADTYDLDLTMVDHNQPVGIIDDRFEITDGGFVPLNNDDDDYTATATLYGEDLTQSGAIQGEDDLLPIVIHGVQNRNGQMKLVYSGLMVYRNGTDRTNPLASGVAIPVQQQDLTLYVEGTTADEHTIELWVDGKKRDTVKVTAFQWVGPLNVPNNGAYEYKVASAPYAGAHWLDPSGGGLLVPLGPDPSDVEIAWLGGSPRVARAIYQVNNSYTWDLEVNLVEISVSAPDAGDGSAFTAGQVVDFPNEADHLGNLIKVVKATGPGISWQAKVTFSGPTLNGQTNRGVRQMRAGFVQNLTVSQLWGTYGNNNNTLTSAMVGTTYWDTIDPTALKLYDTDPAALFENATSANTSKLIKSSDSPGWGPPTLRQGIQLTYVNLVWDFDLYVVGLTWDQRNAANTVYRPQAEAQWQFDGTDSVSPGLVWQGGPTGVLAPTGWAPVSDDMITSGPRFNAIFKDMGWA
jgi:hypothetical protein